MKIFKYFCLMILLLNLVSLHLNDARKLAKKRNFMNKNLQTFSLIKSKQTDCGIIKIDEDFNEFSNIYSHNDILLLEDENIDNSGINNQKSMEAIANLSSCINEIDFYNSFSTRLSSKATKLTFEKYFYLDETHGIVYLKRKIDREKFCAQIKRYELDQITRENSSNSDKIQDKDSENAQDLLNCDCKSETCEFRIKFVAFKDENSKISKHSKSFKYLYLTIKINDVNDQTPKFKEKFLYLNTSEHIVLNNQFLTNPIGNNFTGIHKNNECNVVQTSFQNDFSNLIPIERAFDLDTDGLNSRMYFTLYMFKNTSAYFVPIIEQEKSAVKQDTLIKNAFNNQITNCDGLFELVDSSEMLFLKINTRLDRERQDVYNFILIVSDRHNFDNNEKLGQNNYLFIKLTVNDLNDNQPIFSETKYVFDLLEATEFDKHYPVNQASFEDDVNYYANLLDQTCALLKNKISVNAIDQDLGFNSLIKYKIVQQVHRKSSNSKSNRYLNHPFNSINSKNKHLSHEGGQYNKARSNDNLAEDSLFYIDELNGSICLVACIMPIYSKHLTREKFLELTSLLDYELYSKHILLIEAKDSNPYNPLQSVVTLEINLIDLNDNPPLLVSFQSDKCKKRNVFDHQLSVSTENFEIYTPNISIQYYNVDMNNFILKNISVNNNNISYSTLIIIKDLSEYYVSGDCIGQFLINDLDSNRQNRRIDVKIVDLENIGQASDLFGITNLKNENDLANHVRRRHQTEQIYTNEPFELFLKFNPDAEQKRYYDITLEITDNGFPISFSSYAQLKILIKDENDNEPQFSKKIYTLAIDEWNKLDKDLHDSNIKQMNSENQCFSRIEAYDSDVTQKNSNIFYQLNEIEIVKGLKQRELKTSQLNSNFNFINVDKNFFINKTNGDICVKNKKLLDRETKSKYEFLVSASNSDSSETKLESSAILHINLLDLNDNIPEFMQSSFIFYVSEEDANLVNSFILDDSTDQSKYRQQNYNILVGHIGAFDKDIGLNSELKYFTMKNDQLDTKYKSYFELNTENMDNPLLSGTDNLYLSNADANEIKQDINEDFIYVDYKVTAIRHLEPDFILNSESSSEIKQKYNSRLSKQNKKLFKLIDDLENYIYVNPQTGSIYLVNRIDREQILNIHFYLFVSDRNGAENSSLEIQNVTLSNSVSVTIEIEDINDSHPVCFSQSLSLNKFTSIYQALDVYTILIDLESLGIASLYPPFVPYYSKSSRLIQIYQFECIDNDKNKNSEIKYEIENFYLKNAESNDKKKRKTNLAGDIEFENYFFLSKKIFALNVNSGIVYLNLSQTWLNMNLNGEQNKTEFRVEEDFLKFLRNKFLIIKVKVSDKGIVSLYNHYYLKFFFCFKNTHQDQQKHEHDDSIKSKFCSDDEIENLPINEDNLKSPIILKPLTIRDDAIKSSNGIESSQSYYLTNIKADGESEEVKLDSNDYSNGVPYFPSKSELAKVNNNKEMSIALNKNFPSSTTLNAIRKTSILNSSSKSNQFNCTFLYIVLLLVIKLIIYLT